MNMAELSYLKSSDKKPGLSDDGWCEELRGKFYERYMEKRDVKLREESITKRAQKESKLKAMQEALERTKAEMADRSARSLEKQDPVVQARFEAEKSDDEEYSNDVNEQAFYKHDKSITSNTPSPSDMLSPHPSKDLPKPSSVKKLSSKKTLPSTPQRSSLTSPSPRSSIPIKFSSVSSTSSGCRRHQENPLAQFVPNFADPRKENTNPSTGQTGLTSSLGSASRGQPKSGSRKSGNEDFSYDTNGSLPPSRSTNNKEEKIRHNKAMRKICTSPGAGPGIAKMKDSLAAKNMKNVEDEGEADIQDGEETIDEFGNVQSLDILEGIAEESDKFDLVHDSDAWADSDTSQNAVYRKEGLNQTSDRSDDAIYNNDALPRTPSQVNGTRIFYFHMTSSSTARNLAHHEEMVSSSGMRHVELLRQRHITRSPSLHMDTASTHLIFVTMGLDSPIEIPASWNSQIHHSLSQMLEVSDVDASADSPIGSTASWNSHSLSQMMEAFDTDAARTHKIEQ
ncbi:hypothetical protein KI387_042925 [Taxus chinensis]|uniref:Uncharacterized protein n=1 Tax=Taxus chinensis TaxID=29808 RepID=A0AA38BZL5_TAXCH|nr:hypothetical protein KI387_042925 [Taxus chinensis]